MLSQSDTGSVRRPARQDTFDLRDQIVTDDLSQQQQHGQAAMHHEGSYVSASDEEHSVLEDDSSNEGDNGDYIDDDDSSSLSIPNESIDFDLVYSLTNFAATVEGQASVVKGDSLFLMDDSNSYWWLVRVLKTQEVGYIPAENIETPFERLARLNRHRNVDLAMATQAELLEGANQSRENLRAHVTFRSGSRNESSPTQGGSRVESRNTNTSRHGRGVEFRPTSSVFRYPPAVWNEEEEDADEGWEEDDIEYEDALVKDEAQAPGIQMRIGDGEEIDMEPDDGMHWDESAVEEMQAQQALKQGSGPTQGPMRSSPAPQQAQQVEVQQQVILQQPQAQIQIGSGSPTPLRQQTSRERLIAQQQQQQQEAERGTVAPTAGGNLGAGQMIVDPADVTETKRVVMTPAVARDAPQSQQTPAGGASPTSAANQVQQQQQQQQEDRKRAREDIEAEEEAARKKVNLINASKVGEREKEVVRTASVETRSSVSSGGVAGSKLRKDRERGDINTNADDESGKDKGQKKKGGVFGGLFSRRKDKGREKSASSENIAGDAASAGGRDSEESGRSSGHSHSQVGQFTASPPEGGRLVGSPAAGNAMRVQQQQAASLRNSGDSKRAAAVSATVGALQAVAPQQQQIQPQARSAQVTSPPPNQQQTAGGASLPASIQVSQHALQLRERDQQQQALYQQYLKRSPSSPPDQPSSVLQSLGAIMPLSTSGVASGSSSASGSGMSLGLHSPSGPFRTQGGRPGSLILTGADGQGIGIGGAGVPDLSVVRVFAGQDLQSEATFKTVLLNNSTTAGDLVRQAMQRFRLAAGEDAADYYLTIKQVEGGASAVLRADERPLGVFEELVEQAMEMPKVKRSSMGSISSIASNLSAHPAIRKLPMNDFTDDSAVKFYLNRRREGSKDDSLLADDGDTMVAETSHSDDRETTVGRSHFLSVNTSPGTNVSPERFSSPSFRFALQLIIYPEDLPDDMVFDPHTEAIVFKETLRDRSQSGTGASPGVSQNQRKKVFVFPKNITVAEVIELGLERFGILEGVVDGGDEVEDKMSKRRSSSRVRYSLTVSVEGQKRELAPSSKVIDAFPRPPAYRRSGELKRRSVDSAHLLGTMDDVQPDDPVFILKRAVTYRSSASSRHRLSAPLDEIALSHLHRDSLSNSNSSVTSEANATPMSAADEAKQRQPSRQEIIAAQRAASRANQKALLSAQANSHRGVDVLLPGQARLRSSRVNADDKMRYSYVQPDGETYDISDIVEEEFKGGAGGGSPREATSSSPGQSGDLLQGVINAVQPGAGAKLIDRVLNKINNKNAAQLAMSGSTSATTMSAGTVSSFRSTSPSVYSLSEQEDTTAIGSRTTTPTSVSVASLRVLSPTADVRTKTDNDQNNATSRPRTVSPTSTLNHRQQQPSIASVISDVSSYRSATPTARGVVSPAPSSKAARTVTPVPKKPMIPKDDFGFSDMLAVIELRAGHRKAPPPLPLDEVDGLLFGPRIDVRALHPQIRDVYGDTFKKLEEMDATLDNLLQKTKHLF